MDSPFASLSIPRVSLINKETDRYLIVRANGEKVALDASSAAEAIEKSGITDARRVVNLAFETDQILEKGVLGASGEKVETRITLEEELVEFHVADLLEKESEAEAFVEFDLSELSKLSHQGAPRIREPEVEIPAPAAAFEPMPMIMTEEPAAVAPESQLSANPVEIIDVPLDHTLQPSEKHLTAEEVEALLKG